MRDSKKMVGIVGVLILLANVAIFFWPTPVRQDLRNLVRHSEILEENQVAIEKEVESWRASLQGVNGQATNAQHSINTLLSDFQYGVNNIIIPAVDNSIVILELTELSTPEVIAVRDQYINSLELYRDGVEKVLDALKTNDDEMIKDAEDIMNQAVSEAEKSASEFKALAREHGFIYFD